MTDREIDALVAKHLFAWQEYGGFPCKPEDHADIRKKDGKFVGYGPCDGFAPGGACSVCTDWSGPPLENYSSDGSAMLLVVERMRELGWSCDITINALAGPNAGAVFYRGAEPLALDWRFGQPAEAVCLAALKALGAEAGS